MRSIDGEWVDTVDEFLERYGIGRAPAAVGVLVVVGLLVRLVALGARVAHFDEGRVGYWIVRYVETGDFHYRFIIHGPFVQHVNQVLFSAVGANDFTLRLVVAVIGGVLPLGVLLYREHLTEVEQVAAALFLTLNPVLLYYSRFLRSTVPVAAFAFVAFGLAVRYYDTRLPRYLYAFGFCLGLAFAAKENAAVYVLVWLGASALLLDHELFRPRSAATGWERLGQWWQRNVRERDLARDVPYFLGHVVVTAAVFAVVIVFFYAPRSGSPDGVGLWNAFGSPSMFPQVFDAMVADISKGYGYWFGGSTETGSRFASLADQYRQYLERLFGTLSSYAALLVGFALLGFLKERFTSPRPRNLVMFAAYWGLVSVVGYPLGADIYGPWLAVNILVPLAIPAAVGLAAVVNWGYDAFTDEDAVGVFAAIFVVLLAVAVPFSLGVSAAFLSPLSDENMVQYAQPGEDMKPAIGRMQAASAATNGTDVVLYGEYLVAENPGVREPACSDWFHSLPLPWYFQIHDSNVTCARELGDIAGPDGDAPPVVITERAERGNVSTVVPNYTVYTYELRRYGTEISFFVDPEYTSTGA